MSKACAPLPKAAPLQRALGNPAGLRATKLSPCLAATSSGLPRAVENQSPKSHRAIGKRFYCAWPQGFHARVRRRETNPMCSELESCRPPRSRWPPGKHKHACRLLLSNLAQHSIEVSPRRIQENVLAAPRLREPVCRRHREQAASSVRHACLGAGKWVESEGRRRELDESMSCSCGKGPFRAACDRKSGRCVGWIQLALDIDWDELDVGVYQ